MLTGALKNALGGYLSGLMCSKTLEARPVAFWCTQECRPRPEAPLVRACTRLGRTRARQDAPRVENAEK